MTAVADSSALVASVVDHGSDTRWVDAAFAGEDLACPELALAEASNILRRMELAGQLSYTEATAAYTELFDIDIVLYPFTPFAERIWQLRNNLTIYDAWFVALAEALDCPLVTLDRRLSRAPGPTCAILSPD
ncbi:MAG: type II toxin-antitoxin system VapC family toxin [Chloroflexi bacterium]|nr:type II toxin-antitoxin system VapC family toxin [Chloroflexota bacterium]